MSLHLSTSELRQQSGRMILDELEQGPVIMTHYRQPAGAIIRLSRLRELEATEAKYRALVQQTTPARKEHP